MTVATMTHSRRRVTPTQNAIRVGLAAGLLVFTGLAGLGAASLRAAPPSEQGRPLSALASLPAAKPQPGVMLGAPKGELDAYAAARLEPGLMSVVFTNQQMAWDFYHEAVQNGERVCLADLGAGHDTTGHGQRYWLRSC